MLTARSFNKAVPVVDGVLFELHGGQPSGVAVFIQNQHATNTLVYYFEESVDGSTWTRVEFENGGDSNQFSLIAGASPVLVKVASANPHLRLRGYGDLPAAFGVATFAVTPLVSGTAVVIY